LIYLAVYGFFNRGGAGITLGLLMTLKIAFGVCLVLAQQRFLQNRGLVLMVLTSFAATAIISFLHGLVPGFLVSITDAIGAIIVAIPAVIWAIFLLFGSLGSLSPWPLHRPPSARLQQNRGFEPRQVELLSPSPRAAK
jgi:hypothetical protein